MTVCVKCGHDPDAVVKIAYTFTVDREPPSLNDRLFNSGVRAHEYRKERDAWCWHFRAARLKQAIPAARTDVPTAVFDRSKVIVHDRRRVTLTRLFGPRQRERDKDNLIGGMKAVVDALVSEALIAGDSVHDAEIFYGQKRSTVRAGLEVVIEVLA